MRRLLPAISLLLLLLPVTAVAEPSGPPLRFEAGAVLAGGYVLRDVTLLPPRDGPAALRLQDGGLLHWRIVVEHGETRLLDEKNHLAAKAEYHRQQRNGKTVCLIYQTTVSPGWAIRGGEAPEKRADFAPADDRIYSFRDAPCP